MSPFKGEEFREGLQETKVAIFTLRLAILLMWVRACTCFCLERAKAHSTACVSPGLQELETEDDN